MTTTTTEPGTTTTHTTSINGMQMHVQMRGQGEPLLLLHGFTGTGGDWAHVFDLDELALRYRLIMPDARGHGRSTNPLPTFTHRQNALDTAALLDELGIRRCRAIGTSLGGNTLLHMATRERERFDALVLVSATMYFPAQARKIMREVDISMPDEQTRTLWTQVRGFADDYDDLCFTPPLLATIAVPTLIVYGDRDHLYPVEMAVEMYRAIPGAQLCVLPNAGHGPIYAGESREHFRRAALAFLAESAS
jgi:pimeloyl-ACP methyl ester carboxylesterase